MTRPTDTLPTLRTELRRLAEAATPGRRQWDGPVWNYDSEEEAPWLVSVIQHQQPNYYILGGAIQCPVEADARFIAATDPQIILSLLDHIDALEVDARRYRWLRHGDNDEEVILYLETGQGYLPRNEKLDASIDAALAEQGEPK